MVQYNTLLIAFLIIYVAGALFRLFLTKINVKHLHRHGQKVPPVFAGEIDEGTLSRMTNYTTESARFGSVESIFDETITLVILLSGMLPWLLNLILALKLHFVLSGLIFFGILALIGGLLDIPFDLYGHFVIEKKYGFSTMTIKLWITDLIKSLLISAILMGILLGAFLALLHYAPNSWWFWIWIVFASFQLLMLWLYPIVIAPLFNKYEPVKNEGLKEAIIAMMVKVGLKTQGVYQVDAGKRSKHTNAYFTGLGKTKRIVLYDTLLASHTDEEILSVLAHEIGHWKKKHILKQLIFVELGSLLVFYLFYRLVDWPLLYQTFGFEQAVSYVGLLLLAAIFSPLAFFFTPIGAMITRKFEREADEFAHHLTGTSAPMCNALKRLAKDNLANLFPHPFYAWFYYSHPPLIERVSRLMALENTAKS
jgi:STE24 endopeptidase